MPFIMGTPDEPFLIIYCLALTKHIYKKIKSKYLNNHNLWEHINTHNKTHKENTNKEIFKKIFK